MHNPISLVFILNFMLHAISYHTFSCIDTYGCKPDVAMGGLAIRLYEITIEASDAAGNIGRDQCRVVIIPSDMSIQDVDAILQKSTVRYPVAATTDLGIMLETKTNLLLRYIHDSSQALFNKIDATHSTTSRALERVLMQAGDGEERASTMLNEYMPTDSNIKQGEKNKVEVWVAINAAFAGVVVGFVLGRTGRAG
jgi:hypothetical protein